MFTAHLLPGHGFRPFTVYKRSEGTITTTGRVKEEPPEEIEQTDIIFLGALVAASQKEVDQWKQNGHPITHKIIEYGAQIKAKPCDYLINDDDNRQFYIQGTKNPGDLNVTMIYYVEERFDIKKKILCI